MTAHLDEARLVALGMGEAPSAPEAQHLASCASCAASLEADARLWSGVRALPLPLAPEALPAAALARYRQARGVRHRPREVVLGGLAALVLVAVLGLWAWRLLPGAAITVALAVPRWSDLVATGTNWTRLATAALPALAASAGLLLVAVTVMLRRLTTAVAK